MADLSWVQWLRVTAIGGLYSFTAGFTNAVMLSIVVFGVPVSHVTGTTTRLAQVLAGHSINNSTNSSSASGYNDYGGDSSTTPSPVLSSGVDEFVLLLGFLFGAFLSGIIVGPSVLFRLKLSWRYGTGLLLESLFIIITLLLSYSDHVGAIMFAALAMGLQNGLTTIYSGALLRTTHITGAWTDIGLLIGQSIHQLLHEYFGDQENKILVKTELWRFRFLIPIMVCFVGGTAVGGLSYILIDRIAFTLPILITFITGAMLIVSDVRRQLQMRRTVQRRVYEALHTSTGSTHSTRKGRRKSLSAVTPTSIRAKSDGRSFGGAEPRSSDSLYHSFADEDETEDDNKKGFGGRGRGEDENQDNENDGSEDQTDLSSNAKPSLRALTVRGDWDALPHTMQIRNAARHLFAQQQQQQQQQLNNQQRQQQQQQQQP